jgi:formate dehydrogenase subunit delta
MNPSNLIKMANQIGSFFEAMPNREQAIKDVAVHIQKNWDPRMRVAMFQHISKFGGDELSPMVRDAFQLVNKSD